MNLRKLNLIIQREYLNKVKKKSFLIITFLAPVLFAALCTLPTIIMLNTKEDSKKVGVIDASGIVMPYLQDNEVVEYRELSGDPADVKLRLKELGIDVLLNVSALDSASMSVTAETYSEKPVGLETISMIRNRINDAVESYRIESYQIEDLEKIMESIKSNVPLRTYTLDESGKETISESGVYMFISMLCGMVIFMFIAMFCGMVMSSVIEEKSSRVVEVLVSSVKATELMFGKIIGVALVALTQFLLWIVLTVAMIGAVGAIVGIDKLAGAAENTAAISESMPEVGIHMSDFATAQNAPSELQTVVSTLQSLNYGQILLSFVFFFVFGYLLYASLFAAIGSSVENEADSQQLQIPITIPLMIGFFIAIYAFRAPGSGVVFWASMVPFTSPIVMLARIPFGVPAWELALSMAILAGTFVLCAWLSAKIYKVGILMYGKKTTFKDLWKWLKQN